ncbi:MAG: hypothetical protein V4717_02285 [Bacteroidota bacterium]
MKLIAPLFFISLFISVLFTSCEKEYSLEDKGGSGVIIGGGTSMGTLGGSPGECANAVDSGVILAGTALTADNRITIEMNFTQIGTYYISTDTVNGIYFSKNGIVNATGPTQIVLTGSGKPTVAGVYSFIVSFKGSTCSFDVTAFDLPPVVTGDYFPTTAASYWSYISSDPAAATDDTLRNTATSVTYTLNSNQFTLFKSQAGVDTDSLFFSKSNGEYHQFGDLDLAGTASNVVAADYIFLKDNVAAGTEWFSPEGDATINSATVKIRLKFTIAAKDVTASIGTTAFNNVIKVTTSQQAQSAAGWSTILTFESWYARGIGLIKLVAPTPFYGYEIKSYQVL